MDHPKKVLVLGATGAMGQYLVPRLASMGYRVDAVALVDPKEPVPGVSYLKANVKEPGVLQKLLENRYDGIVDFMIYSSWELPGRLACFVDHTDHYIYLSSYRIYDNKEHPIRESSPRLIDASENIVLRNSDDYSIYKARGETILRSFSRKNWTIIRPAITYSLMRYQLVTLEAPNTVGRARAGKAAVVPEQAKNVQATMSWAGDVARMIESIWVDKEEYISILNSDPYSFGARWQLEYDRLFDRIIDNSKILAATGMTQAELMPLYDGLEHEISRCPADVEWPVNERMDSFLAARK